MEISQSRSLSLSFDTMPDSPAASSYPPSYVNCRSNMHTVQGIQLAPDPTISRPFVMKSSLSIDSATSSLLAPKKENFLSSMFGAVTSIVVQRFAKLPNSFMSNINSTLSVTVVPNEGIISQEFFKNLTQSCDQSPLENNKDIQEPIRVTEILPNNKFCETKSHLSHIFADDLITNPSPCKVPFNSKNDTFDRKEPKDTSCGNDKTELNIECTWSGVREDNDKIYSNNTLTMKSFRTRLAEENDSECPVIPSTDVRPEVNASCSSRSTVPKVVDNLVTMETPEETGPTSWSRVWQKVLNGMTDRSSPRTVSPESEVPTKKANLAKPRRKTCPAARGRGKGRGKSQLRRSGVSQSRHRKERTKQNIYSNIQDDIEAWEDSERYGESGEEESSRNRRCSNVNCSPCQESDRTKNCSMIFENFCFGETSKSRKRKQRTRDGSVKAPVRVRYLSDSSSMEIENCGTGFADDVDGASRISNFRPRLVSESSVDSEDSCCIVFESGSDSEYTDYDYDVSDEELEEDTKTTAPRVIIYYRFSMRYAIKAISMLLKHKFA